MKKFKMLTTILFLLTSSLTTAACSGPAQKTVFFSKQAPEAIGPYSHGVRTGNLIFTSGQIPINPATGEIVSPDIRVQTKQALENLKNVLQAGGSDLDHVLKTTLYIKDMNDFSAINDVYGSYFKENCPARSCVEVSALPKGALIEIEAVALAKK
ncbi:MAG TPA: RidA family protein [Bacillota bacterium]|nr:RidA family protein [Peptococcaceae bacterium MAG4]HPZ44299.1 RidA family protein [Bacillota bacterium]HQD77124.1 RidA family protein [Bacillota bacterium]HUM59603.1 RidA family protein [Bacillota bacterium]